MIAIAMDIDGDVEECKCGAKLVIRPMMGLPEKVAMFASIQEIGES